MPEYVEPPVEGFPKIGVTTFSKRIIDAYAKLEGVKQISAFRSSGGNIPVYQIDYSGIPIAFYMSLVGAPACSMQLEEAISKGLRTLVAFGSCGVLDKSIVEGHFVIPTAAMRDEGTSYHYLPSSSEVMMSDDSISAMVTAMEKMGYPWIKGKTWTIDAPYRETRKKTILRKEQGCITVEMECSALLAVSKFRETKFAQFLYAADNLDATKWEPRDLLTHGLSNREKYMLVAFESAIRL